jgi:multicomponent Na+:H+ antiporter subunit E
MKVNLVPFTFVFLYAVYVIQSGNYSLNNLVFGLLVALLAFLLLRPMIGGGRAINIAQVPLMLIGMLQYLWYVVVDVIKCGINVAKIVLDPKLPIRPGIVAVKSRRTSDFGTALSAHAITITPGEMVIEIGDDGVMYTHCLDAVSSGEGADGAQANRNRLLDKILLAEKSVAGEA